MDIPSFIVRDLCELGRKYNANYISLFGSRAKGTNGERSDIDIAVSGIDDVVRFSDFRDEVENIRTLLMFDIVNLESDMVDGSIREDILKNGVVLYEKV